MDRCSFCGNLIEPYPIVDIDNVYLKEGIFRLLARATLRCKFCLHDSSVKRLEAYNRNLKCGNCDSIFVNTVDTIRPYCKVYKSAGKVLVKTKVILVCQECGFQGHYGHLDSFELTDFIKL